jgi:hypothetical protein
MSLSHQRPTSCRDDIALQFMLAMARDTALTPDAMATRAYAMADAFVAQVSKIDVDRILQRALRPTSAGDYDVPAPAPANHGKPFDKAHADEIPF